jgi:ABC-2 type transport system ATP-binding protein
MIDFQGLAKSYGNFEAVKPLTLSVARGEVFGFLGPNGAGKTTTIRMMMGILVPNSEVTNAALPPPARNAIAGSPQR